MPAGKLDFYAVLGLINGASDDAIRSAYKKLALQWHPDRHLTGKEHAAQMFIEVNEAYHALMDGRESAHSSTTETSSTTTTSSSADPTHSDSNTKCTSQESSRPPSASSHASKRSSPQSAKPPSSTASGDHSSNASKVSSPPSNAPSPHQTTKSHSRPAKPSSADGQRASSNRTKSGRKFSKTHDHLRDPPGPTAKTSPPPSSTHNRSSEGLGGPIHSRSPEKYTRSSPPSTETKHDSRADKTLHGRSRASHTSKPVIPPSSGRLHKPSKLGLADEFMQKLSKGTAKGKKERSTDLPGDDDVPSYGSSLRAINTPRGASKEWLFPLPLTLDEMYHGTSYRFLVTRELLSRRTEEVEISIDIPPGTRGGTRIVCAGTGHQRKDGTLQDVIFLVEEVPDERFSRINDDLYLDVCVPWEDALADQGGELCIEGMDGEEITFALPYPLYGEDTDGQVLVKGAGMPIREGRKTIGRGDMIVRWRVVFSGHQSKWRTFKKVLHMNV
ncbi:DnaJ domain-containing protein [Melanogaster broomeanus]|nr:DnaJ domain-containing protein [Melanogaster broomeanus]